LSTTKIPKESEFVALTDILGLVEPFEESVSIIAEEKNCSPSIYQDSTSVITLVTNAGGVVRTKHLQALVKLGKELIEEKRVKNCYCRAKNMKADDVTKLWKEKLILTSLSTCIA
jgi:hypothetical protein